MDYFKGHLSSINNGQECKLRLIYPSPFSLILNPDTDGSKSNVKLDDLLCDYLLDYDGNLPSNLLIDYRRYIQVYTVSKNDKDFKTTLKILNIILRNNG